MEIEVLEKSKNRVKFVLKGAGHTFCNNLKRALNQDDQITTAAYSVNHPLVGTPTFIVEKKAAGEFAKIFADAAKSIKNDNATFAKAFAKL